MSNKDLVTAAVFLASSTSWPSTVGRFIMFCRRFFCLYMLLIASLVQATTTSCASTKTVTKTTTLTPTYTTYTLKTKTVKLETYTETYLTTVATASTTATVTLATATVCTPTDCSSCEPPDCYPGCGTFGKRQAPSTAPVNTGTPSSCAVTKTKTVTGARSTVSARELSAPVKSEQTFTASL